jgi:hypothetical protein
MGFALRLCWLWLGRVDSDKTWLRYSFRADDMSSQEFFDASVTIQVGDSSRAVLDGSLATWLFHSPVGPDLWNDVPPRIRKSRTVRYALLGNRWVRDITFAHNVHMVVKYLHLWDTLREYHLSDQPDIWKWSSSGDFSSSTAYRALFVGRTPISDGDAYGRFSSWPVPLLWVACVAWSLLDLEPIASSWASGLGWLCTLRTKGQNFRSHASQMCP